MKTTRKLILVGLVVAVAAIFFFVPTQVESQQGCTTIEWEGTWDDGNLDCVGGSHVDCSGVSIACPSGPLQQT